MDFFSGVTSDLERSAHYALRIRKYHGGELIELSAGLNSRSQFYI